MRFYERLNPEHQDAIWLKYQEHEKDHRLGLNPNRWREALQILENQKQPVLSIDSDRVGGFNPRGAEKNLKKISAIKHQLDQKVQKGSVLEESRLNPDVLEYAADLADQIIDPRSVQPWFSSSGSITEQTPVAIKSEYVPDALFQADSPENENVYVMIAANADTKGGGLYWGTAQEEAVYAASDLGLYVPPGYLPDREGLKINPLVDMGLTYLQKGATAYHLLTQEDGSCHLGDPSEREFHVIYAANPDFRSQDQARHLMTPQGHNEFVQISFRNYFQTIAHAAYDSSESPKRIKLNAIGCGAFNNPHFLVAASARLAIEKARLKLGEACPILEFSIGGSNPNAENLRATFNRVMQMDLSKVSLLINRNTPEYAEEMRNFILQRAQDQSQGTPEAMAIFKQGLEGLCQDQSQETPEVMEIFRQESKDRRIFNPHLDQKTVMEQQDKQEWARKFAVFDETLEGGMSLKQLIEDESTQFPLEGAFFDQFKSLFKCNQDTGNPQFNGFAPLLKNVEFQRSVLLKIKDRSDKGEQDTQSDRVYLEQASLDKVNDESKVLWGSICQTDSVSQERMDSDPVATLVEQYVPDVLFDEDQAAPHRGKMIFIQSAAHDLKEGGAFDGRGNAQEEALYQNSDAALGISGEYPGRLRAIGGVYLHPHVMGFKKNDEDQPQYTGDRAEFNIIQSAALDFRAGERLGENDDALAYAMMPEGQKAYFQLNYSNYYHTLELAHNASEGNGHVYLSALGCGAFLNPPFLVAAAARLAIDQFKSNYQDSNLTIQFAVGPQHSHHPMVQVTHNEFEHYMSCSLDEVKRDLNPKSQDYQSKMIEYLGLENPSPDLGDKYNDQVYQGHHEIRAVKHLKDLDQKVYAHERSFELLQNQYKLILISNLVAPLCVAGFVAAIIAGNVTAIGVMLAVLALGTWGASGLKQLYYSGQDNMLKALKRSLMILSVISLGAIFLIANMPISFSEIVSLSASFLNNFSVLNTSLPMIGSGLPSIMAMSVLMLLPCCCLMIHMYRGHHTPKNIDKITLSRLIRGGAVLGFVLGASTLIPMVLADISLPLVAVSLGSSILLMIEAIKSFSGIRLEKTFESIVRLRNELLYSPNELLQYLDNQPILANFLYNRYEIGKDEDTSDCLKSAMAKINLKLESSEVGKTQDVNAIKVQSDDLRTDNQVELVEKKSLKSLTMDEAQTQDHSPRR
ncbi:MAG: hypothetical protein CMF51_04505 [Legionellales bacterium]|nr:hypothetical protein [Legionellales bacterium]